MAAVSTRMPLLSQHSEKPTVASALRSSTLLNPLSEEELVKIERSSTLVMVDKGEIIWLSGSQVDFFGLVATGFVKMTKSLATGSDVTIELVGPGQIFGFLGVIDGQGCPLTAQAVTDCWVLRVSNTAMKGVYDGSNRFKDHVVRRTAKRLRSAHDLLARIASGRVEQRIAAILLLLAESYAREVRTGVLLEVPLTRQEIADMAGTTVESAIRLLSRWQKEGIISTGPNHYLTLRDLDAIGAHLS